MYNNENTFSKRLTVNEFLRQFDAYQNQKALVDDEINGAKNDSSSANSQTGEENISLAQALAQQMIKDGIVQSPTCMFLSGMKNLIEEHSDLFHGRRPFFISKSPKR